MRSAQERKLGLMVVFLMVVGIWGAETQPKNPKDLSYKIKKEISYINGEEKNDDEYLKKMCVLDLYYPEDNPGFATIIWFHGGGLEGGRRYIPGILKQHGFAVVAVEYRLMPKVEPRQCIDDAAAATAWVAKNISNYGGNPAKIFISGHSAGGYLTAMLGLDKKWLQKYGVDSDSLAGYAPFSGQMTKHFNIRKYFNDHEPHPVVDEWAPMFHIRKNLQPFLLITGDRNLEFPGRPEENLFMAKSMKLAGNEDITMYEMQGHTHMMEAAGHPVLIRWINGHLKKQE